LFQAIASPVSHGAGVAWFAPHQGDIRRSHPFPREWKAMMVPTALDAKGTRILAKSLFKELRGSG